MRLSSLCARDSHSDQTLFSNVSAAQNLERRIAFGRISAHSTSEGVLSMFDRLKRAIRAFVREDSPPPAKEPPQAIQHPEQLSAKKKVERRHPRRIKSRAQGQLLLKVRQQQISQAKADFLAIKVPGPFRPKTDHCTSASVSADRSDLKKNKSMKEKPGNTKNRTEAKESASEEDMGSEAGSNDEEGMYPWFLLCLVRR